MQRLNEYYKDKTLLLTGGTGLMGKVLIETILRQLREVRRVYVLVRPKSRPGGALLSSGERLWQELRDSKAFDQMRLQLGEEPFRNLYLEKIHAVSGDLSFENLGLDPETYRGLQEEVEIILNCAAFVSFDAPIDMAIALNTRGPRRLLEFARGDKNPLLVHVSTCYVNATRKGPIPEEPLDPRRSVGQTIGLRQKPYDVEEEVAAILAKSQAIRGTSAPVGDDESEPVSGNAGATRTDVERADRQVAEMGMRWARSRGWHDVYTFTKAMGEQIFLRHQGQVRAVIIRPAIIESSLQSPAPGWLSGFRMLDPLIIAYGRGRLMDFPGNATGIADIIPVDLVVNATLSIAARAGQGPGPLVYHIASGMENPITLQGFADRVDAYFQKNPLESLPGADFKALRKPTFPTTRRFLRRIKYRYMLPVRGIIALATISSFNTRARKLKAKYRAKLTALDRLSQYARLYGPYAEAKCQFLTTNTRGVWESLGEEDRRDFNFDISKLNWTTYLQRVHIPGIKKYLLGIDTERDKPPTTAHPYLIDGATSREVQEWTRLGVLDRAFHTLAWVPVGLGVRYWTGYDCHGLENVPLKGPFIVAANHNSHMDTALIFQALGEKSRDVYAAAARDYFFRNRWVGWMVHAVFRAVPFDRQGPVSEGVALVLGLLGQGHSVIFYPEGGRGRPGEMQPFKNGIGVLALFSGAPVIPAYIWGTHISLPKGSNFPKRHRVSIRFGPPIQVKTSLDGLDYKAISDLCRGITSQVQKAVEALNGSK